MVLEKVKAILAEQFDIEEDTLTVDTDLQEDLGADSLDVVDLLMSIEDEFESSTVICSFSFSQIWLPPMEQAWAEAVRTVSHISCPASIASIVKSSVMTLVTLAGSSFACSSLEKRMVPVSFSISSAEGADTSMAAAEVVRTRMAHKSATSFFMDAPPLLRYSTV